jgi:ABC-type glycerol-3-phosphate transport system permease component
MSQTSSVLRSAVAQRTARPSRSFRPSRAAGRTVLLILAILAAIYALFPIVLVLAGSFQGDPNKIVQFWDPLSIRAFIPSSWSTASYSSTIDGSFGTAMLNSIIVAVVTVGVGLVMAIMAAFALSVLNFRFKNAVFALVVVSFLIPFDAVSIPLSGTFRAWGLSNSLIGLIIPGLGNGLAVFLLRQFFLGIPRELVDAARVDGMGTFKLIAQVFVPLSKPAVIGAGLILFTTQWQEYLWPLLVIGDENKQVAPVAIGEFVTQFSTDFRGMFAAAVLTTALPMVAILLLQRYFTQSVIGTGDK